MFFPSGVATCYIGSATRIKRYVPHRFMPIVNPRKIHFKYMCILIQTKNLKDMAENQDPSEGDGQGQPGEGDGDPFGGADSFDDHDQFGEGDATTQEIAKERLKEAVKQAAEEAEKARTTTNTLVIASAIALAAGTSALTWGIIVDDGPGITLRGRF